jgi:hypothetical protein
MSGLQDEGSDMTTEELEAMARTILRKAARRLVKRDELEPSVSFFVSGQPLHTSELPGSLFNDPRAKAFLFKLIGDFARQQQIDAVFILTDAWRLSCTPEQSARMASDGEYRAEFDAIPNLPDAAAAGFGELMEGIQISAQTQLYSLQLFHRYERVGARIELREIMRLDSIECKVGGTIMSFFEQGHKA